MPDVMSFMSLSMQFGTEQALLVSFTQRAVDLSRAVPRLIDQLSSLHQHALSGDLDLAKRRELHGWLEQVGNEGQRIQREVFELKDSPVNFRTFDRGRFDEPLALLFQVFDDFDVPVLRRRVLARRQASPIPPLLVGASEALDPDLAALIRDKLNDPRFAGSEGEKSLQHLLGYWDWQRPDYWA